MKSKNVVKLKGYSFTLNCKKYGGLKQLILECPSCDCRCLGPGCVIEFDRCICTGNVECRGQGVTNVFLDPTGSLAFYQLNNQVNDDMKLP